MPPQQFRDAIAKLGLSQERAGLWLGPPLGQSVPVGDDVAHQARAIHDLGQLCLDVFVGPHLDALQRAALDPD
jgi:hypothetical protein